MPPHPITQETRAAGQRSSGGREALGGKGRSETSAFRLPLHVRGPLVGVQTLFKNTSSPQVVQEFCGLTTEEWVAMKSEKQYVCPRCDYPLVPVHAVEGSKRRVIALTCPEPYCDHMQLVPRAKADGIERAQQHDLRQAAN